MYEDHCRNRISKGLEEKKIFRRGKRKFPTFFIFVTKGVPFLFYFLVKIEPKTQSKPNVCSVLFGVSMVECEKEDGEFQW